MKWVKFILAAWFLGVCWLAAQASGGGDGKIAFYVYHLKERAEVGLDDRAKIQTLFRSRDSSVTHPIHPSLVRLLNQIEDHFGVRQVEIISGYRSRAFNRELKETGHHVANESLHTKGMAADIHLDEITEEALRDYAISLKAGGVGFYPSLNMVHVDVGPVRAWGEDAPRKKWVGEKNESVPVTITVSPDRLFSKDLSALELTIKPDRSCAPELSLEFFDRDVWKEMKKNEELPFGKYRYEAKFCSSKGGSQYSNEFYLKKM